MGGGEIDGEDKIHVSKICTYCFLLKQQKCLKINIKKNKDTIYRKYKLELDKLSKKDDGFEAGEEETTIDRVDLSEDKENEKQIYNY